MQWDLCSIVCVYQRKVISLCVCVNYAKVKQKVLIESENPVHLCIAVKIGVVNFMPLEHFMLTMHFTIHYMNTRYLLILPSTLFTIYTRESYLVFIYQLFNVFERRFTMYSSLISLILCVLVRGKERQTEGKKQ